MNRNYFLYGQLAHLSVGLVGFVVAANLNYRHWRRWLPFLIIISGFSLLLLMIPALSINKNGATRWVNLGIFSYQPAEVLKLTVAIGMASYFARLNTIELDQYRKTLWPTVGLLGLLALLVVVLQRDLGTMLIIASIIAGIFFTSGVNLRQLGILAGISVGMGLVSIALFPHRVARILTFFNPNQNLSSSGYHLSQALIALGSGGLLGVGIGKSVSIYGYLPEAASDSIFAIIGETFGLMGALVVMFLFGFFIYRCMQVARNAPDRFAQLLVLGISVWVGLQTAINILAMVGMVPLTGIPLPFLSYGGTSLIVMLVAIGIVFNISKYTQRGGPDEDSLGRRRVGGAYNPTLGYRQRTQTF